MGTSPMSQPTDTRRHPIAAYRAVRKLMQNREDTRQVFLLIDALRGKTTLRQLARFRQTEFGQRALAERRRLFDRLEDWETLKALPAGTLGRAYYEFMASENLSAAGLAKVSTIPQSRDARPATYRDRLWPRSARRSLSRRVLLRADPTIGVRRHRAVRQPAHLASASRPADPARHL